MATTRDMGYTAMIAPAMMQPHAQGHSGSFFSVTAPILLVAPASCHLPSLVVVQLVR